MSPLLHVQQEPCAYLPSSRIYKCYRCVISSLFPACSAGAVCLLARQQNNLSTDVISSMFPVGQEPRAYLPNSKNPCWYEQPRSKKGLNCLPYVYLAGVAKCGTSDLSR